MISGGKAGNAVMNAPLLPGFVGIIGNLCLTSVLSSLNNLLDCPLEVCVNEFVDVPGAFTLCDRSFLFSNDKSGINNTISHITRQTTII
ncbi:MAG: hypothetical protein HC785_24485 [Calothrix sp. CSU_2_0]|nr:hypothetical protein [Calothrix sp. CSU_2_0]